IVIECREEKGQLLLSFADDGPGFSEKSINNLFQPFTTADEHIDNNKGLGLYIVNIIAVFHDARISISNKAEGGALVELRYPKTDAAVL
ncbi:MAG: ATP-binding protein, partial [Proteiniphilum sp.]|nr:ATP-binding protein [Proteiniphilum sp.]